MSAFRGADAGKHRAAIALTTSSGASVAVAHPEFYGGGRTRNCHLQHATIPCMKQDDRKFVAAVIALGIVSTVTLIWAILSI
jgi:hypothetical protein